MVLTVMMQDLHFTYFKVRFACFFNEVRSPRVKYLLLLIIAMYWMCSIYISRLAGDKLICKTVLPRFSLGFCVVFYCLSRTIGIVHLRQLKLKISSVHAHPLVLKLSLRHQTYDKKISFSATSLGLKQFLYQKLC